MTSLLRSFFPALLFAPLIFASDETTAHAPASHVAPAAEQAHPADKPPATAVSTLPAGPVTETVTEAETYAAKREATTREEHASLLRIGAAKLASGDFDSASIAFRQVAQGTRDPDEEGRALAGLARTYRLAGDRVKAIATYERMLRDHPSHTEAPAALLESGRLLRELGSPKLAINRFYSVLYSTLRLPEAEAVAYRRIVRTAQFEIAETHLSMGNYTEAIRFFNRLDLVELAPADHARARFKSAQARVLAGEDEAAVAALQNFISLDPEDVNSPEARFMLATLLARLDRPQESLQVTLDLLRHQQGRTSHDPELWRTWQRRTGNQIANQFYNEGEFASALALYQTLVALDENPAWRIPLLYQTALCHERLLETSAALDTYQQITTLIETSPGDFSDLARMTSWRIGQLGWWNSTEKELQSLTPPRPPVQTTP